MVMMVKGDLQMKVNYSIMGKDKCHAVNPTCYNSYNNRNAYD